MPKLSSPWSARSVLVVRPNGKSIVFYPDAESRRRVRSNPGWGPVPDDVQFARVIVGFSVGSRPVYKLADLEQAWVDFATANDFPKGATIVPQRGVYKMATTGKLIRENGATLTVLNLENKDYFASFMRQFAAYVATKFRQEEVIVQVGNAGRVEGTYGIWGYGGEHNWPEDAEGVERMRRTDAAKRRRDKGRAK